MLPPPNRLKNKEDFRKLYRQGRRAEAESLGVVCVPNNRDASRFGVVVRKNFGKAVSRNRAKRKARFLASTIREKVSPCCDVVLFPRKGFLEKDSQSLREELRRGMSNMGLIKEDRGDG